jgi:hypothetical protein
MDPHAPSTNNNKHYLLFRPPFDLTDRLETRQQTPVLILGNTIARSA